VVVRLSASGSLTIALLEYNLMRVLHFYRTYLPDTVGGAEQSIYHLCRAGAEQGIENRVLTLTPQRGSEPVIQLPGHQVERVASRFKIASVELSWRAVLRFRQLVRDADVVHYHFPWPMGDIAHLLTQVRKPSIVTYHADIQRGRSLLTAYRPVMHRFLRGVDRIVATSPNYAETSDILQLYRRKLEIVPLGLTRNYYPSPSDALIRHWKERIGGGPFFLFVGVFRYYKGLPVLIDAIRRTGYPVVIVGDGPLGPEIRALAKTSGATGAHFTGSISEEDKMALIQLSSAIVFPSPNRAEAFGMSLLEGAMMGKPMITCEIGTGTSYVNVQGETGLVVAPDDPADLALAMQKLWNDRVLCERMGRRALSRFEDLFTAQRTAASYKRIYQSVIAEERGRAHQGTRGLAARSERITTSSVAQSDAAIEKR
jgi:glycosyltransferase involved in cell wall biosynthesis